MDTIATKTLTLEFGEWCLPAWAIVMVVIGALLIYALTAFLLTRLFKKAGVPTWKAWVPVYNLWKLLQIGGVSGVWSLLSVIACGSAVTLLLYMNEFQESFTVGNVVPAEQAVAVIALVSAVIVTAVLFAAAYIRAAWNITRKLGKNWVYLLLLLVNLGPSLWLWIMALDNSKWDDKLGAKSLAPEMKKKGTKKK
ncbi:MAG: DUF5684 domain-containing protein [Candidatus Nomurabacteria bacterium]|jgi:hypothetical protein|nr:DUF5684 domain-containing protein [Candidatus Nomurabacteria bacterium]